MRFYNGGVFIFLPFISSMWLFVVNIIGKRVF